MSFLRGINVGGRNIKMLDLRNSYESLGLLNVKTYLQSGNVRFDSQTNDPELVEQSLEASIAETFNYPAKVFVYYFDYIEQVVGRYPFDMSDERFHYYVIFTSDKMIAIELVSLANESNNDLEQIAYGDGVVYWKVLKGQTINSPFSKNLLKNSIKDFHTTRNIRTLTRIISP